jgi:hypothetical protein
MFVFKLELIGGPCDGWRSTTLVSPGRVLRVRFRSGVVELLEPGELSPGGQVAEYRFRDVAEMSSDGPRVTLRYDFTRYASNATSPAIYNRQTRSQRNVPAPAPGFWRRLLASTRRWLLAPVDFPGRVHSLQ